MKSVIKLKYFGGLQKNQKKIELRKIQNFLFDWLPELEPSTWILCIQKKNESFFFIFSFFDVLQISDLINWTWNGFGCSSYCVFFILFVFNWIKSFRKGYTTHTHTHKHALAVAVAVTMAANNKKQHSSRLFAGLSPGSESKFGCGLKISWENGNLFAESQRERRIHSWLLAYSEHFAMSFMLILAYNFPAAIERQFSIAYTRIRSCVCD